MNLFSKMWFAFFDEEFLQVKPKQPAPKPQQVDESTELYIEGQLVDEPDEFDLFELGEGDDSFDDIDDIDIDAELGLDFFE